MENESAQSFDTLAQTLRTRASRARRRHQTVVQLSTDELGQLLHRATALREFGRHLSNAEAMLARLLGRRSLPTLTQPQGGAR